MVLGDICESKGWKKDDGPIEREMWWCSGETNYSGLPTKEYFDFQVVATTLALFPRRPRSHPKWRITRYTFDGGQTILSLSVPLGQVVWLLHFLQRALHRRDESIVFNPFTAPRRSPNIEP